MVHSLTAAIDMLYAGPRVFDAYGKYVELFTAESLCAPPLGRTAHCATHWSPRATPDTVSSNKNISAEHRSHDPPLLRPELRLRHELLELATEVRRQRAH